MNGAWPGRCSGSCVLIRGRMDNPAGFVGNYVLIGDVDDKHLSPVTGYRYMKRLAPHLPVPKGYKIIEVYQGRTVHVKGGFLLEKFWSLPRIMELP